MPQVVLSLSRDCLKAYLNVAAGTPGGEKLSLEMILAAGQRLGLAETRFNPESLHEIVDAWNRDRGPIEELIVAESLQPARPGEDGKVQWLVAAPWVKTGEKGAPHSPGTEGEAARRDMREVNTIMAVEKGTPILRILPAGKGVSGEDLLGRLLPALDGKPSPFKPGIHIEESSKEPGLYLAQCSGFLKLKDGRPEIQECFVVDGDVDYGTGNIRYERSASIKGDVQDGFGITLGGDLVIGGTVGDCRLVVGGDVSIQGGFQGKGQGLLLTKGKAALGFCSNQTLKAYGGVEIAKEAYNMNLFTRDTLVVHGPIVGGRAIAGMSLDCASAGNDHGTPTSLEIGFDFVALEGLQEVETRLKEYGDAQARFQTRMLALKETYRTQARMNPDLARELVNVRQALDKLALALPILHARKNALSETLRKSLLRGGLQVRVEKKVHAGVTIKIGQEHIRLNDDLAGPRRFVLDEGRIKIF